METKIHEHFDADTQNIDYLVFTAKDHTLGLPYFDVIQIVDSPVCTSLPNMPAYFRGAIDLMGEALPLIDVRIKLSIQSRQEEVAEIVNTFVMRKQDHLSWIDNLKRAVELGEQISVERDPHKCAFGKWYDTYNANSLTISQYMAQFDMPHKGLHRLADQAEELIEKGQKEQAKLLIHAAENKELIKLIQLFDGFEEKMRESYHEYAIVVSYNDQKYAIAADSIKYFEKMDEIVHNVPLLGTMDRKMIRGIGRKKIGDVVEDVIILNLAGFLDLES